MNAQILNRLWQLATLHCGLPNGLSAAEGSMLSDSHMGYIDFYSGAGRFNYGYNNQQLLNLLNVDIDANGIIGTGTRTHHIKSNFLNVFAAIILKPRKLDYDIQLASPNSACALESAIGIARYATGRKSVISFAEGFHGAQGHLLGLPAQQFFKKLYGFDNQANVTFMPYDKCLGPDLDTIEILDEYLVSIKDTDKIPAAVVVETVAAVDGSNAISWRWLKDLQKICSQYDIKLILDDTQVGCGRTGKFFSFEGVDIKPDVVVLTKSISGFGLPISILLTDKSIDTTGMKTGSCWSKLLDHDLALLSATHAVQSFWSDDSFSNQIQAKEIIIRDWLENIANSYKEHDLKVMGRGLVQGLVINSNHKIAENIAKLALDIGLVVHTSGLHDQIIKVMPALTINHKTLISGLEKLEQCIFQVLNQSDLRAGKKGDSNKKSPSNNDKKH